MTRVARLLAAPAVLAILSTAPALAQVRATPATAFAAEALSDTVPAGLDAAIPVRIVDLRTGAPTEAARIASARLVSPFGAPTPVRVEPVGAGPGLRTLRADLLAPGAWSLELTLADPRGVVARASIGFTVAATLAAASSPDPAGASVAAGEVAASPLPPSALAASGPGGPGQTTAPAVDAARAGATPSAATASSFCADCAAQAPR